MKFCAADSSAHHRRCGPPAVCSHALQSCCPDAPFAAYWLASLRKQVMSFTRLDERPTMAQDVCRWTMPAANRSLAPPHRADVYPELAGKVCPSSHQDLCDAVIQYHAWL